MSSADRPCFESLIPAVEARYASCDLCEHRCGVDRLNGETGVCGLGRHARCFSEMLTLGEWDCPTPTHTIYLSGCDLRCRYCWAHREVEDPGPGDADLPIHLAARIRERSSRTASLAFIGGSPTVNLLAVLETLSRLDPIPPVVWNCDLYATPETVRILREFVSLFVIDLKFGNDACAEKIANAPSYTEILERNLRLLEGRDVVIRHLLMPGHIDCCALPVIRRAAVVAPRARIHLLENYRPFGPAAKDPLLGRSLAPEEVERARRLVRELELESVA